MTWRRAPTGPAADIRDSFSRKDPPPNLLSAAAQFSRKLELEIEAQRDQSKLRLLEAEKQRLQLETERLKAEQQLNLIEVELRKWVEEAQERKRVEEAEERKRAEEQRVKEEERKRAEECRHNNFQQLLKVLPKEHVRDFMQDRASPALNQLLSKPLPNEFFATFDVEAWLPRSPETDVRGTQAQIGRRYNMSFRQETILKWEELKQNIVAAYQAGDFTDLRVISGKDEVSLANIFPSPSHENPIPLKDFAGKRFYACHKSTSTKAKTKHYGASSLLFGALFKLFKSVFLALGLEPPRLTLRVIKRLTGELLLRIPDVTVEISTEDNYKSVVLYNEMKSYGKKRRVSCSTSPGKLQKVESGSRSKTMVAANDGEELLREKMELEKARGQIAEVHEMERRSKDVSVQTGFISNGVHVGAVKTDVRGTRSRLEYSGLKRIFKKFVEEDLI